MSYLCQSPQYVRNGGEGYHWRPCHNCPPCQRARLGKEDAVASHSGIAEASIPSCESPVPLYGRQAGTKRFVPCRKCEKCRRNKHTQIGGRALAEALVSDHVIAVTLTYGGGDQPRSQSLVYRDVQLMIKRLRRDGYKVRYLVAGEYGTKRARAHWHIILYFRGAKPHHPPVEMEKQHWNYWYDMNNGKPEPIGFAYFQEPDYYGLLYLLKYAVKDEGTGRSTRNVMMSKKPPLGAAYWPKLMRDWVKLGKPFTFEYTLPGAAFANGNAVRFYQDGPSAVLMWKAYRKAWFAHPGNAAKAPPVMAKERNAWLRRIVPAELRSNLKNGVHPVVGKKTCQKILTLPEMEFYKLWTGDLLRTPHIDTLSREREIPLWRVHGIGEVVAARRGRHNAKAERVGMFTVPF